MQLFMIVDEEHETYMGLIKGGKGYTQRELVKTGVPRLFTSKRAAEQALRYWKAGMLVVTLREDRWTWVGDTGCDEDRRVHQIKERAEINAIVKPVRLIES